MSLDYHIDKIQNYKEVCYAKDGKLHAVTELMIFTTIHVGMGEITEANAGEFYARMIVMHKLHDIGMIRPGTNGKAELLTPAEVQAHIGLTTNVSYETRAAWLKRIFSADQTGLLAENKRNYNKAIANTKTVMWDRESGELT